jgi:LTXXQ motif family protein
MLKMLSAGMTALVVITGSSVCYAQTPSSGPASERVSAADLNALLEARVEIVKTALQLTADQQKYWPAIEEAMRSRAKERQTRLAQAAARIADLRDRSPIELLRDRNPIEFLNRRSDALAQRAAELKKVAGAWQPLYQTLSVEQKRRLGFLAVYALRELKEAVEQRRIQAGDDEGDI